MHHAFAAAPGDRALCPALSPSRRREQRHTGQPGSPLVAEGCVDITHCKTPHNPSTPMHWHPQNAPQNTHPSHSRCIPGPAPHIATTSPFSTSASSFACHAVASTSLSNSSFSSGGPSWGTRNRLTSAKGTLRYSACPPSQPPVLCVYNGVHAVVCVLVSVFWCGCVCDCAGW